MPRSPTPKDLWSPAGPAVRADLAAGCLAKVLEALQDRLTENPRLGWAYALSAEVKRDPRLDRFGESEEDLARAWELEPQQTWIKGLQGKTLAQAGSFAGALKALASVPAKAHPWVATERAFVRLKMGDAKKALSDALDAVLLSPRSREAHWAHAACLCTLNRWESALETLRRVERLRPDRPGSIPLPGAARSSPAELRYSALRSLGRGTLAWPQFWKGEEALSADKPAEAEGHFTAGLAQDPGHAWSWAWRAWARLQQGELSGASADLNRALKLPLPPQARSRLYAFFGHVQRLLGKNGPAESALRRSIALDNSDPLPRLNRAEVLFALKRPTEAESELYRALEAAPDYIPAYMARAGTRLRRGDEAGSLSDARRVLTAAGSDNVKNVLTRLLEGESVFADVPLPPVPSSLEQPSRASSSPIPRATSTTPEKGKVLVDPGVELAGFIKLTLDIRSGAPLIPEFCARDARVTGVLNDAMRLLTRFIEPRLLAEFDATAKRTGNSSFPWLGMTQMMMGVSKPPDLRVIAPSWRLGGDLRLLGHLRSFSKRSRFMDFFNARRGLFDSLLSQHRSVVERESYAAAVSDYTGLKIAGFYDVTVSLFLRGVSLRAILKTYDGAQGARTVYCPLTSAEDYRRLLLEPGRSELLWTGWHELLHLQLDAWTARHQTEVEERKALYPLVSASARRKDWPDCFSEHLVRAATIRLLRRRLGAPAAKSLLGEDLQAGYRMLPGLLSGLKEYEAQRSRYPTLLDYFPRWLSYWPSPDRSGERSDVRVQ